MSIKGVDAKSQRLVLTAETTLNWVDNYIKWDPAQYNNIRSLLLDQNEVWTPDIHLYNSLDSGDQPSCSGLVRYSSNGKAQCRQRRQFSAFCPVSLRKFPFDEHRCILKFLSMTQDGYMVDVYAMDTDINFEKYLPSRDWIVSNSSAKREVIYYSCCVEPFPEVNYNITIKRQSAAYGLTFVAPGVVLALLVPFVFLSLPFTGDKTGLAASIQVSYILLVVAMMQVEPAIISSVPYIVMYYIVNFVLVGISLGISLLIASSFRNCKNKPPKCLKKLVRRYIPYKKWIPSDDMVLDDVTSGTHSRSQEKKSSLSREEMWIALAILIDRILFFVFFAISLLITIALFILPAVL
ncbi:neuronal acetylcholine receptor subunit alpha-7-like isoform X2 [Tubulanus polymorphus]